MITWVSHNYIVTLWAGKIKVSHIVLTWLTSISFYEKGGTSLCYSPLLTTVTTLPAKLPVTAAAHVPVARSRLRSPTWHVRLVSV